MPFYTVRARFKHPAWNERDGLRYDDIAAKDKSDAISFARRQARNDGHTGVLYFTAEEVQENPMGPNVMLGPGGKVVDPKSESRVLDLAIDKLHRALETRELNIKETIARRLIASAIQGLEELLAQVEAGYHRNPKRGVFSAGEARHQMSDDVHEIFYTHRNDGDDYHHPFKRGEVEMWAIERGGVRDLLLTHKGGKPLWDDFPD